MAESADERRSRLIFDIKNESPSVVISRWVLDPIPYVFDTNTTAFSAWRHTLAEGIGVDPREVLITGTACTGVSLNPYKSFKAFDAESDVDVAVISGYHFEAAWRTLRHTGARTLFREPRMRSALDDHKTRLIYWGTIATDKILGLLPFGETWLSSLGRMAQQSPTLGRSIKARVYRDFDSLRSYQIEGIRKLRENLVAPATR
jgi:hypothetical protein